MCSTKVMVLLGLTVAVTMAMAMSSPVINSSVRIGRSATGTPVPLTDLKKVADQLNRSLAKLAAGDGPNYKLGKVYSATTQIVSGSFTRIVADLVDRAGKTKKCNVSIWSQSWLPNGIEVTFACPNEPKLIRKHSA